MDIKYFVLGNSEDKKLVKMFRILFGAVCIILAISWIIMNIKTLQPVLTHWITILFLIGFGIYQIWAGLGLATRFIEIKNESIRLKKNSILPPEQLMATDIESLDIYPLNIVFLRKAKSRLNLRFGTINYETNERIVDEIISFAETNKIPYVIKEEKI